MAGLTGSIIKNSYKSLLRVNDDTNGVDTSLESVTDGEGTTSAFYLSDDQVKIKPTNDDTTSVLDIQDSDGNSLLAVDSTNDKTILKGTTDLGVNSTTQGKLVIWDGSGGNTPAYIQLHSPNGTAHYLFFEDDGTLKQHTSAPTANSDGNVVGSQS